MTTTIRTTCSNCQLSVDVPSSSVVLALPAATADVSSEPTFVHICPGCRVCCNTTLPWRAATYLLLAGATSLTAPDTDRLRLQYPEQLPATDCPMTLDDLIDLHAALDSGDAPAL